MAYKILYIEDQAKESRESDFKNLGFDVEAFDPSSDLSEIMQKITAEVDALILDYRLTAGERNSCFDAPTIAQTLRSKHSHEHRNEIPIILMSNEEVITDYYSDFSSQDLFDFTLTKKEFGEDQKKFAAKLISFVTAYERIKKDNFEISAILGLSKDEENILHENIHLQLKKYEKSTFEFCNLIYDDIIRSIGPLIGEDLLSARLGVSKDSPDWGKLLDGLNSAKYSGILSDIYDRWWMDKINIWWKDVIKASQPLRHLDAEDRVNVLTQSLQLKLVPVKKTEFSKSSNFWAICKVSHLPIDPFDGIELLRNNRLAWQEKEYLSFDSALTRMDDYKECMSIIDRQAVRELSQKANKK